MDQSDQSFAAYEKLQSNMPSIGFFSRKKRIKAYVTITRLAEEMIKNEEISQEQALFLLSILVRKSADFQKATMMTALNLANFKKDQINEIGMTHANEFRAHIQMLPIEEADLK